MAYTISQVADMMGITASALRDYDKEGLLPNIKRMNGVRVFDERDFEWLRVLNCLKHTGMPIRKIKTYVALAEQGDASLEARYALIQEQRAHVQQQIDQLQYYMQELDYKDWYYRTAIESGSEAAVHNPRPASGLDVDRIPSPESAPHPCGRAQTAACRNTAGSSNRKPIGG